MATTKKTEWRKFGDCILYIILLFLVLSAACNPTTPSAIVGVGVVFAEATPLPPMACLSDFQCPIGMFCRINRICASCVDCDQQHRYPKPNNECAKGSSECGPCKTGYKLVAEHCTDEDAAGNSGSVLPNKQEDVPHSKNEDDDKTVLFWSLGVLTVIGVTTLLGVGFFTYRKVKNARHRRLSGSGEKGQGGDDEQEIDESNSRHPSAPLLPLPEEYLSPPPYAEAGYNRKSIHQFANPAIIELMEGQTSQSWNLPNYSQRVVNNLVAASPFNAGNGAGDWAQQPDPEILDGEDNNDGGVPPPLQPPAVVAAEEEQLEQDNPEENEEQVPNIDDIPLILENPVQDPPLPLDNNDIEMVELGPNVFPPEDNDVNEEEEEEINLDEAQEDFNQAQYEEDEQIFQHVDDLYFNFEFHVGLRFEPTLPAQRREEGRARSHSASNFPVDGTILDMSPLTNDPTSSHASSALSMARSSDDSGTGTSNEDDHPPPSPPARVPSLNDPISSSNIDAENDDSGLYEDDLAYVEVDANDAVMVEEDGDDMEE